LKKNTVKGVKEKLSNDCPIASRLVYHKTREGARKGSRQGKAKRGGAGEVLRNPLKHAREVEGKKNSTGSLRIVIFEAQTSVYKPSPRC